MKQSRRLSVWGGVYVATVVALGATTIIYSAYQLNARPIGPSWFVLALLTLLSGLATVKLPTVAATISVSETFVFTSVLLFGPAAGTLTVTLDVLAISLWLAHRKHPNYRIAFNVFALPAALWVGGQVFYYLANVEPLALSAASVQISSLLLPLVAFTTIYFGLNSWLIAIAIWFETGQSPLEVWKNHFAILSLNYFGGASVAALLVTYTRNLDYTYVAFVLPLLAVLYFTFSTAMGRVEDANRHLSQLNALYMSTIETLAMAIDAKDQITHGHIRRVQAYAVGLADHLGVTDKDQISAIEAASLLHDMGKLAVPEYILNKPGPLTSAEFEKMKMHAGIGADILSAINFPYPVVPIVRHHHENWNGTGYPDGIAGADIPIGARILSVVDCFDALTSDRPYRPRLPDREAIKILLERRGTMYDPLVVDTFVRVYQHIGPKPTQQPPSRSLRAVTSIASSVDTANKSLDEISAGSGEMVAMLDLVRSLSPTMSSDEIAAATVQHIRRLIPSSLAAVFLLDSDTDEVRVAHAAGADSSLIAGLSMQRGQNLSGWVAANCQTIRNSDPVLDFGETTRIMNPRPRSALSTPLVVDQEVMGVLTVYAGDREAFDQNHERILESVARQIADPIRQARARRQTESDPSIAGCAVDVRSADAVIEAAKHRVLSRPAALLLVHIERVVTAAGSEPDAQLVERVGRLLAGAIRPTDVLLKHSAEAFAIILPSTTDRSAEALQRRLLETLSPFATTEQWSVRISIATTPPDGSSVQQLIEAANHRLPVRPIAALNDEPSGLVH
jgi:putative nucleotidyltransferase with HDIG domain